MILQTEKFVLVNSEVGEYWFNKDERLCLCSEKLKDFVDIPSTKQIEITLSTKRLSKHSLYIHQKPDYLINVDGEFPQILVGVQILLISYFKKHPKLYATIHYEV